MLKIASEVYKSIVAILSLFVQVYKYTWKSLWTERLAQWQSWSKPAAGSEWSGSLWKTARWSLEESLRGSALRLTRWARGPAPRLRPRRARSSRVREHRPRCAGRWPRRSPTLELFVWNSKYITSMCDFVYVLICAQHNIYMNINIDLHNIRTWTSTSKLYRSSSTSISVV